MNFFKLLRKNSVFAEFSDKEINALFDCLKGRIVLHSRGVLIAKEESEVTEACILLDGTLLEFSTTLDGRREPLATLEQGDSFGFEQGYLPEKRLPFSVVAVTDVTLLYLDISSVTNMCEKACPFHQQLVYKVMRHLCERIQSLKENNNYITTKGMRQKIARLIFDKYSEQGVLEIRLGMDRNQMAEYLNVSRPSMSREMMRMRDEGMFDFWKDKISIKDLSALENVLKKAR